MTNEDKLAAEIQRIEALHKENKDIDTSALIANVLAQNREESVPSAQKMRAYLVSLLFPPFGLYYFVKFIIQDNAQAKRLAWTSLALTIIAIIFVWWLSSAILSSSPELQQIQNINLKQLQELTQ